MQVGAANGIIRSVPTWMNIHYILRQMWFHGTAKMTEYIRKIAYQSVIKCNACTVNEICMTNWLWRTQSRQVLWTLAQKLIEIPFIMTVVQQRNRKWERQAVKEEYKDFWLQRQESLASYTGRVVQFHCVKSTQRHKRWAFSCFIYKCFCMSFSGMHPSHGNLLMCTILHLSVKTPHKCYPSRRF